jgi:hypothetical protein
MKEVPQSKTNAAYDIIERDPVQVSEITSIISSRSTK